MFQNVSGQTNSTVADLTKFNMRMANEHYKVKKEDSLEAILLALHLPGDKVALAIFFFLFIRESRDIDPITAHLSIE